MKQNEIINYLIVVVILWALYKVNQILNAAGGAIGPPTDATTGGSEDIKPDTSKLTYPASKYAQMADTIESAIWGGSFGFTEDDDKVEEILKQCMNDEDYIALSNAYGIRGRGVIIRDYYNLNQTIEIYVDESNRLAVNDDYQAKGMYTRV